MFKNWFIGMPKWVREPWTLWIMEIGGLGLKGATRGGDGYGETRGSRCRGDIHGSRERRSEREERVG